MSQPPSPTPKQQDTARPSREGKKAWPFASLKTLVAANLVVLALVSLLSAVPLLGSRDAYVQRARDAALNLARSLEQSVDTDLDRIDMALVAAFLGTAPQADAGHMLSALAPEVSDWWLADSSGAMPEGDAMANAVRVLAQKELRKPAKAVRARSGLTVLGPLLDPRNHQWRLILTRRLQRPDGRLDGMVHVAVPTSHFDGRLSAIHVGQHDAITLRCENLQVIGRHADRAQTFPIGSAMVSPDLLRALKSSPDGGSYMGPSIVDKVTRITAYQRVGSYGLLVLVGVATQDYLQPWRSEATLVMGLDALALTAMGLSSWRAHRAGLREIEARMAEQELQREHALRTEVERHAEELDALLRERSEMLDVLAHEVRQPLNNASAALQGAAAVLSEAGDSLAAQRVTRAQDVLSNVLAQVDNTLAEAALLARVGPIEPEDEDVDTLIAVAIADMPLDERGRILIERDTPTRTASMDMSLMRLALRNLLSNALRYSAPGSPVTIRLSDSDEPLALLIDVSNACAGVDPVVLPRLFERGARGRSRDGQSSHGLGLYIVRRVMELHGGQAMLLGNGPEQVTLRMVLTQAPSS